MKKQFTDDQVEREIERLENSQFVRLARKKDRVDNARLQRMYTLRALEKKGIQLAREGWTLEMLDDMEVEE